MQLTFDSEQLPVSWEIKYLDKLSENLDSKRVPITKSLRKSGNIPYYGASGIVDYVAGYIFDEDLLLVSEDGANLLARTYPIAFSITGKTWVNNHAHILRFKEKTTQRFIEYYLNSISLEPYISGMAQPKLNQKSLNSIAIPFPPLPEQKRIVAILDEAFEGIDRAIANTEKNLANARELFESYLNAIFTQKGDGWEEKKLGDISTISYGYTEKASQEPIGPKFLRITDIQDNQVNWETVPFCAISEKDYVKHKLSTGDIVFARTGATTGKSFLVINPPDAVCASYLIRLCLKSKDLMPEFLILYFQTKQYRELISLGISGSAQGGFNASKLADLVIPVAIDIEQVHIVDRAKELLEQTQRLEAIYRQKIAALNELKQSILQKAFTGELTADTANQTTKAANEGIAA
ncbi:restriction endonuclease subunit S [Nostoc sp. UIC 10630]|uniref:restriction endonuclease subunit S n=1 Tax=Nostoc sp. UIC 10630 TaxID=2100146 RepID=UPI0013D8BFBA|nr:restriction endonuclease subunit S [Nostoc sp. UIC 10630]NEU80681.1 restriction endonuclease subunit S [Nostoc sp. UIC 10630]